LFKDYTDLFEGIMHRFIETEGLTAQQFYSAVSRELDEQLDKDRAFASVLLSAIEFESFCTMMSDVHEGRGVVFCPPLISLEEDFYGDQDQDVIPGAAMAKTPFSSEYEGGLGFDSALCKDSKVDRSSLHTNTNDSDVKEYKMYGNTEQGSKAEEKIQIESSDCK